jgi:short-subunit dehydrogenase
MDKKSRWLAFTAAGIGLGLAGSRFVLSLTATDLHGKVVLITGSSRGLGLAMAEEFGRKGARLVLCARSESELERAGQQVAQLGVEVITLPCDISDREQVQKMVDQVTASFGQIDVLVNNAGIITVGPMQTMTLKDYEESMAIMYWGSVYTTLAVLPSMLQRKSGHIVNITSIGGKVSVPHLLPYSSAKFAMIGFSEGLHAELAREGVHVLTVVPGLMRTGSPGNAFFKGKHRIEYTLFNLLDTLPFTSISAAKAARQIVRATRQGRTEIILSPQAQLASRVHGLFPGITNDLLTLVNRFLPSSDGEDSEKEPWKGAESTTSLSSSFLTVLGELAAERYNER